MNTLNHQEVVNTFIGSRDWENNGTSDCHSRDGRARLAGGGLYYQPNAGSFGVITAEWWNPQLCIVHNQYNAVGKRLIAELARRGIEWTDQNPE